MPTKPCKPCNRSGCPNVTTDKTGYCDEHKPDYVREAAARRDKTNQGAYNSRWEKVRKSYLKKYPLCEWCNSQHKTVVAVLVHHIDHDPRNNKTDNLMALCNECHERHHAAGRFGNDKRKGGMR